MLISFLYLYDALCYGSQNCAKIYANILCKWSNLRNYHSKKKEKTKETMLFLFSPYNPNTDEMNEAFGFMKRYIGIGTYVYCDLYYLTYAILHHCAHWFDDSAVWSWSWIGNIQMNQLPPIDVNVFFFSLRSQHEYLSISHNNTAHLHNK